MASMIIWNPGLSSFITADSTKLFTLHHISYADAWCLMGSRFSCSTEALINWQAWIRWCSTEFSFRTFGLYKCVFVLERRRQQQSLCRPQQFDRSIVLIIRNDQRRFRIHTLHHRVTICKPDVFRLCDPFEVTVNMLQVISIGRWSLRMRILSVFGRRTEVPNRISHELLHGRSNTNKKSS